MSKTLSDLPMDLHRLILSHDEEKLELKKENEKLKTRVKMLQCLLDEARQDSDSDEDTDEDTDEDEDPENPANEALYARQQRKLDLGIVDSDFDSDEDTDEECEECCRGKGNRPQIYCACKRCNRIICKDCHAVYDEDRYPIVGQNSHYVPDSCDFCWEKLNAVIDPDQYVDDGKGEYELTAYEFAIDKIIDEHTDCRRQFCERREHLSKKTAFKQWVKKDE